MSAMNISNTVANIPAPREDCHDPKPHPPSKQTNAVANLSASFCFISPPLRGGWSGDVSRSPTGMGTPQADFRESRGSLARYISTLPTVSHRGLYALRASMATNMRGSELGVPSSLSFRVGGAGG